MKLRLFFDCLLFSIVPSSFHFISFCHVYLAHFFIWLGNNKPSPALIYRDLSSFDSGTAQRSFASLIALCSFVSA